MITKHSYKVMTGDADGFAVIHDQHVRVGASVKLTEDEAKYLQLAGIIGHHPLDRDQNGRIGGSSKKARRPSIADKVAPKPEAGDGEAK